jgi:hypothetical protein
MEDAGGHLAGRPRSVVANTPRLEPLGRSRVKSGDRREKWNAKADRARNAAGKCVMIPSHPTGPVQANTS